MTTVSKTPCSYCGSKVKSQYILDDPPRVDIACKKCGKTFTEKQWQRIEEKARK